MKALFLTLLMGAAVCSNADAQGFSRFSARRLVRMAGVDGNMARHLGGPRIMTPVRAYSNHWDTFMWPQDSDARITIKDAVKKGYPYSFQNPEHDIEISAFGPLTDPAAISEEVFCVLGRSARQDYQDQNGSIDEGKFRERFLQALAVLFKYRQDHGCEVPRNPESLALLHELGLGSNSMADGNHIMLRSFILDTEVALCKGKIFRFTADWVRPETVSELENEEYLSQMTEQFSDEAYARVDWKRFSEISSIEAVRLRAEVRHQIARFRERHSKFRESRVLKPHAMRGIVIQDAKQVKGSIWLLDDDGTK